MFFFSGVVHVFLFILHLISIPFCYNFHSYLIFHSAVGYLYSFSFSEVIIADILFDFFILLNDNRRKNVLFFLRLDDVLLDS